MRVPVPSPIVSCPKVGFRSSTATLGAGGCVPDPPNVNVTVTPELGIFLARLNFSMMFGRFALDTNNSAIWFDETLLGEHFSDEEFRFAVHIVSTTADQWDDKLKQMFGGATFQESLKQSSGTRPPVKPGEGPGLYL